MELGAWNFRSRPRLRFVFPAQPEQVEREKRDEPAVAVLFVVSPLRAEVPTANEPQRTETQNERNQRQPGAAGRGGLFNRRDGRDGGRGGHGLEKTNYKLERRK